MTSVIRCMANSKSQLLVMFLGVKAKEAKEAFSAKQQQIERLKQHAFLEA